MKSVDEILVCVCAVVVSTGTVGLAAVRAYDRVRLVQHAPAVAPAGSWEREVTTINRQTGDPVWYHKFMADLGGE